jgi:hypothetical protein
LMTARHRPAMKRQTRRRSRSFALTFNQWLGTQVPGHFV